MDEFMHDNKVPVAHQRLEAIDAQMDSILFAYEQTHLVKAEAEHLPVYKSSLSEYSWKEKQLLYDGGDFTSLDHAYDDVRKELLTLSDIQLEVGAKLAQGHRSINGSMNLLDTLQTGLLLALAILIIMLIREYRSTLPPVRQRYADLN